MTDSRQKWQLETPKWRKSKTAPALSSKKNKGEHRITKVIKMLINYEKW